jgi:hypothetical protein
LIANEVIGGLMEDFLDMFDLVASNLFVVLTAIFLMDLFQGVLMYAHRGLVIHRMFYILYKFFFAN